LWQQQQQQLQWLQQQGVFHDCCSFKGCVKNTLQGQLSQQGVQ
jgi:hypothetical protein